MQTTPRKIANTSGHTYTSIAYIVELRVREV
jgi:hypothetical protein